jgi:hypothetical protein
LDQLEEDEDEVLPFSSSLVFALAPFLLAAVECRLYLANAW